MLEDIENCTAQVLLSQQPHQIVDDQMFATTAQDQGTPLWQFREILPIENAAGLGRERQKAYQNIGLDQERG